MHGRDGVRRKLRWQVLPPVHGNADLAAQQGLRCRGSKTHKDHRLHRAQLRFNPRPAGQHFTIVRLLVPPPPSPGQELEVLHGVRDVRIGARNAGALECGTQHSSRRANERLPSQVFLVPGLLANQHDRGTTFSRAEYGLRGVAIERAPAAGLHRGLQSGQRRIRRQESSSPRVWPHTS